MEFFYRCSECGTRYEIGPDLYLCPACAAAQEEGRPLRGILEVDWEERSSIDSAGGEPGRGTAPTDGSRRLIPVVLDLLPVPREYLPPIPVGRTPLWEPERLRAELGLANLYLKDDGANPTFSFKDRASWLVAAAARMWGVKSVAVASTGNAASSMAGVGAAAGLDVSVFAPADAPRAKLVQCRQYGATVVTVEGGYGEAYRRSLEHTRRHGGINRNTAYNPLTIEGKKTVAFEIVAQLAGEGPRASGASSSSRVEGKKVRVPDYVFVPTGDGVILSGVYKGFRDLVRVGAIERVPTIVAAQAEGSAAIARALERRGTDGAHDGLFDAYRAQTIADSISVDVPAAGYYAVEQLAAHGGRAIVVSDEAILTAQHTLAAHAGLFAEPAAAASFAALETLRNEIDRTATVVVLLTGSGLKDIDTASRLFATH